MIFKTIKGKFNAAGPARATLRPMLAVMRIEGILLLF
jgi:hypothetical protein